MQQQLHDLAARFSLAPDAAAQLWKLADTQAAPPDFAKRLARLLIMAGALLIGVGAIFLIAANWQQWGRMAKFGLLEVGLVGALVAAVALPKARVAALLLATLLLGALLAFIGQSYQTGADPWQLFAFWALLSVPWMLAARRDLLWTFWISIVATGISLWIAARPGGLFDMLFRSYRYIGVDWLMWFSLVLVAYAIQRFGLAGNNAKWTLRLALMLALSTITLYGSFALPNERAQLYIVALGLVAALLGLLWVQRPRDLAALCVAVLSIDILLIAGWARLLTYQGEGKSLDTFLLIGLGAAAIVGASVTLLLKLHRTAPADSASLKGDAA